MARTFLLSQTQKNMMETSPWCRVTGVAMPNGQMIHVFTTIVSFTFRSFPTPTAENCREVLLFGGREGWLLRAQRISRSEVGVVVAEHSEVSELVKLKGGYFCKYSGNN